MVSVSNGITMYNFNSWNAFFTIMRCNQLDLWRMTPYKKYRSFIWTYIAVLPPQIFIKLIFFLGTKRALTLNTAKSPRNYLGLLNVSAWVCVLLIYFVWHPRGRRLLYAAKETHAAAIRTIPITTPGITISLVLTRLELLSSAFVLLTSYSIPG